MQKYIVVLDQEAIATLPDLENTKEFGRSATYVPSDGHTLKIDLGDDIHEFIFVAYSYILNCQLAICAYEEAEYEVRPGVHPMEEWGVTTCLTEYPTKVTESFVETDHPFMPFFEKHPELFAVSKETYPCNWKTYRKVDFEKAIQAGLVH